MLQNETVKPVERRDTTSEIVGQRVVERRDNVRVMSGLMSGLMSGVMPDVRVLPDFPLLVPFIVLCPFSISTLAYQSSTSD